ncbi:hypothetical protein [Streptomyces aidingensis]|uniref:SCO2584 family spore wall biosynthesis protein n=1 Tax=Streptomyces aidingensis TaxID=910347 RepID=UPI001114E630|nr:hypothetical protein [Streptomyces aidingensis]
MPEEVGGQPFPDGQRPDDHDQDQDHGAAEDAFAAVVFDEAFVAAAAIREPSAAERIARALLERAAEEAAAAEGAAEAEERAGQSGFFLDPGDPADPADPPVFRPLDGSGRGRGEADGEGPLDCGPAWIPDEDLDALGLRDLAPPGGAPAPGLAGPYDRPDHVRFLPDPADAPAAMAATAGGGHGGRRAAGEPPPGRRPARWQRPVACVLAVMMGLSMIAIALIAVQRAGAWQRGVPQEVPPPSTEPGDTGATTGTGEEAAPGPRVPGPAGRAPDRQDTGAAGGGSEGDATGRQSSGTPGTGEDTPGTGDGPRDPAEHATGNETGNETETETEIVADGLGPFPAP